MLLIFQSWKAQGWQPVGARSMSMANSTVAVSDVWSFHHNPGALANLKQISAGLSYENRYLLKELQTQAFVVAIPFKVGIISAGVQTYGYKIYRTTRIGFGYSMKLGEKLSAGVQMNYQGLRIENYGSKSSVTAEAGILAKINDKITVGFSILNFGRAKLSEFQDDRFSTYLRLGINYKLSERVMILAEAEKEIETRLRAKAGLEYELLERFYTRFGAASNPMELTFGFGYRFKNNFKLDLGSAWQQHLGWSPHFGLTYDFKSKINE